MASSSTPLITRESIKVIAQSAGIAQLKDEVADTLAPDVEYRLRDIIQEALKFMSHGRRNSLSTEDINYALRLRNAEPLYGFAYREVPHFCRAGGHADVFYLEDPEINLADILSEPLPPIPVEPSFTTHWLAINGVQPTIPQNPAVGPAGDRLSRKRALGADGFSEVEETPMARHALTAEEQSWLDRVTSAVRKGVPSTVDGDVDVQDAQVMRADASWGSGRGSGASGGCRWEVGGAQRWYLSHVRSYYWQVLSAALRSVATDSSTHPLSPYLTQFIATEVNANLLNLPRLQGAMRLTQAKSL